MSEPLNWLPELEELVEEHQSMVYSIALRMTADSGLAEELAQDVFLELDRNLSKLGSAEHVRHWLRRVTLHRAADALRRRRVHAPTLGRDVWVELEEQHGLVEMNVGLALAARVEELLAGLPEAQRAALVLRYQEDLTPEEIAVTLEAPVATVKSHLQRGLKRLRAMVFAGNGRKTEAGQKLREYVRGS